MPKPGFIKRDGVKAMGFEAWFNKTYASYGANGQPPFAVLTAALEHLSDSEVARRFGRTPPRGAEWRAAVVELRKQEHNGGEK